MFFGSIFERKREIQTETYRQDIKVHCFNGNPILIEVVHKNYVQFFDTNWNLQDFTHTSILYKETQMEKPQFLDKLIQYSQILSSEFSYVRIDFAMDDPHILETDSIIFSDEIDMVNIYTAKCNDSI